MSVTGLVTVNISSLHPVQQVLLLILFLLGDYSVVSLIMVNVRKRYFRQHCSRLLAEDMRGGMILNGSTATPALRVSEGGPQTISSPTNPRPFLEPTPETTLASSPESYDRALSPEIELPKDESPTPSRGYLLRQRTRAMTKPNITSQNTTLQAASVLPQPSSSLHTGMGGFPGVVSAAAIVLPKQAREAIQQRIARPNRQQELLVHESDWTDEVRAKVSRWLPDTISSLVIGRNGRFFTEELDDNDLVRVGGVEYRALILLSWFVSCVSHCLIDR